MQPGQAFRAPVAGNSPQGRFRPGGRASLTQLPPTLTDEQLARLDQLTRDAIDERLRVLGGVSGTIQRCIEELTRIRSVLPLREEAGLPPQPPIVPPEHDLPGLPTPELPEQAGSASAEKAPERPPSGLRQRVVSPGASGTSQQGGVASDSRGEGVEEHGLD